MKKFPLLRVMVGCWLAFSSSFSILMVFIVFQPFMVKMFFPNLSKEQIGWRMGYLSLAFFLGNFLGGFIWGWLADICGRRPSVLLGIIGSILFATIFGFSKTFYCAVAARFGWGIISTCYSIVIPTYLTEILDGKEQRVQGFTMYGISLGLAPIFSPIVGGFFTQPAKKYEVFNIPFFCDNPFVLPILFSDILLVISFIGVYFVFEETLDMQNKRSSRKVKFANEMESGDSVDELYSNSDVEYQEINGCYDRLCALSADTCRHLIHVQRQQFTCIANFLVCGEECSNILARSDMKKCKKEDPSKHSKNIFLLLKTHLNTNIVSSLFMYTVARSIGSIVLELFILLIISDKQHGGYNMTDQDIGFCFLIAGIADILYQFFFNSTLLKVLGMYKMLVIGLFIYAITMFLLPWGSSIPTPNYVTALSTEEWKFNETNISCGYTITNELSDFIQQKPALVWIIVILPLMMLIIARTTSKITSGLLVNNTSPSEIRGTINGIGTALVSLVRAISCLGTSIIFAWSQSNSKSWPLNYHFVFILLSAIISSLIVILICSSCKNRKN